MTDAQRWSREATVGDVPLIRSFVEAACRSLRCSPEVTFRAALASTEICTNTLRHGYGGGPGWLDVRVHSAGGAVTVTIADRASPFDPGSAPSSVLSSDLDEREPSGLGLHLVARLTDQTSYRDLGEGNEQVLTIVDRGPPR